MIQAIAIDDEPKALQIIRSHAERIPFLSLQQTFTNPFLALEYINSQAPDLIFLDIKMPDLSGLDFSRSVKGDKTVVIFTTAHSEYALESYELEALDYLLKPFDFARFLRAVMKAQDRLNKARLSEQAYFFVNTGFQQRKINYHDINYLEGSGNYIIYHTSEEKIMVRSTIRETLGFLPVAQFVQIHRSFIISLTKLDKIQDNHAYVGNHKIAIGASHREELMKRIGARG